MLAVDGLCTRAICLHEGKVVLDGKPSTVTAQYLQKWLTTSEEVVHNDFRTAPGNELIRLHRARVRPLGGSAHESISVRSPFIVEFEYWKLADQTVLDLLAEVFNEQGINVFASARFVETPAPSGLLRSSFVVPGDLMNNGTYRIDLWALLGGAGDVAHWKDVLAFEVHDTASELRGYFHSEWPGVVRPTFEWKTELIRPFTDDEL
jgi:lipopolysaccharide transport system ATP-binding protein